MDIHEIRKYLVSGSTKSICVSRSLLKEYSCIVRDVIINQNNVVKIEYNTYGYDEGGFCICFFYSDEQILIKSLEDFMGLSISSWNNITATDWYPEQPQYIDFERSGDLFKKDLRENSLLFPSGYIESQIPSGYWKDYLNGESQ